MKRRIALVVQLSLLIPMFIASTAYGDEDLRAWLKSAEPSVIVSGRRYTEGPLWLPGRGLLFSDLPENVQYIWNRKDGLSEFRNPSGYANGSALMNENFLISAQHDRSLTKVSLSKADKVTVLATHFEGGRLNSPNDVAIAANGDIYFTDPVYGIIGYGPEKAEPEQPVRGIYRLKPDDGSLSRLAGELEMPNGLAFSKDGKTLYVANSGDGNLYQYSVTPDGRLENLRIFAVQPVPEGKSPAADGIKVDGDGNVWACSSGAVSVYAASGEYLGRIDFPAHVSNLAFGGPRGNDLFVTVTDKVFHLSLNAGK